MSDHPNHSHHANNRSANTAGQGQRSKSNRKSRLSVQQLLEQQHPLTPDGVAACLVCYAPLTHPGITPCDHNEICALCHLRLRFLHQDLKCPICKSLNDLVIVDSFEENEPHKLFGEYPTAWGDDEDHLYMGDAYVYRGDSVKMFFEKEYYDREVVPLFGFNCHNCNEYLMEDQKDDDININADGENRNRRGGKKKGGKPTVRALQEHLKSQHGLSLCQLCVDHKRDFVAKLPRFTPNALQQHLRHGDGPHSGFAGHPICEFCKPTRFYDASELFQHLQRDHYKCHVCEQQGQDHQYFRDYSSLAKHFERKHFLCPHGSCLEIRFVVFSNELDLRKHLREVHGEAGGDTKLQLEFRYRSSRQGEAQTVPTAQDFQFGLDGQAFVPEALVSANNNNTAGNNNLSGVALHPLHLERTAQLRAQAAQLRQEQEAITAFPSLQETVESTNTSAPSGGPLQVGWTSATTLQRVTRHGNQGVVTEEDFPSLPATTRLKSVQRQFAAMQSAASNPRVTSTAPASSSAPTWSSSVATAFPALTARPSTATSVLTVAESTSAPITESSVLRNRQSDLAPDNFPALVAPSRPKQGQQRQSRAVVGGGSKYDSAEQLAARLRQQSLNSDTAFPTLGRAFASNSGTNAPASRKPPPPPSFEDTTAFPPPPSARSSGTGNAGNVLSHPTTAASLQQGEATVEDMKATMGTARYKQLKALTKEFASDEIKPKSFCEQAAALFDEGMTDSNFLRYIPMLLSSLPNTTTAQQAHRYIQEMRVKVKEKKTATRRTNYDAAEHLAERLRQQNLSTDAAFPALGETTASSREVPERDQQRPSRPPSIDDTTAFPPPPASSTVRNNGSMNSSNVVQVPTTSASLQQGEATVEDMKAIMGTTRYKQLKAVTKEFASNQITPKSFCDQASALFDNGCKDSAFLQYIPVLLSSLPNTTTAQQAQRYIQEMRAKAKATTTKSKPIKTAGTKYDAAEQLAARLNQQNLSTDTDSPILEEAIAGTPEAPPPVELPPPPSIEDTTAFPPPPANSNPYAGVQNNGSGNSGNILQVPTTAASLQQGEATVEDMKATMGTLRYKQLKALTKEFASDQITPKSFCDQAAALFDKGFTDSAFSQHVPMLLSSLPNTTNAQRAQRYVQEMRVKAKSKSTSSVPSSAVTVPTGWLAPPTGGTTVASETNTVSSNRPLLAASNKPGFAKKDAPVKNAWGAGSSAAVLATANAPSKSGVAAAAEQEGPQTGTATKYMAQQQKQQVTANKVNAASTNCKKKKEKDELRALAYGK